MLLLCTAIMMQLPLVLASALLAEGSTTPKWAYKYKPGAIGAGNDVVPPEMLLPKAALTKCDGLPRCRGITFHGLNSTTTEQKVYFKSSTRGSNDPSWTTYLKEGIVTPPVTTIEVGGSSNLVVELRKDFFTVQSLNDTTVGQPPAGFGVKPSAFSFTRPLDQGSSLPLSVHLGDMTLRMQDATATDPLASTFYSTALISAPAKVLPAVAPVLASQDITELLTTSATTAAGAATAAAFPLASVVRSYEKSSDGAALIMKVKLTNGPKPTRLVGLGFAMPQSPGSGPASKTGIQQTVWNDPHVGGEHGFVEFTRVVDQEATLLVTPETGFSKSTKFEAWRPMLEDIAGTDAWEWVVHSSAWAAEWAQGFQTPFLTMSNSTHGEPDMFPDAKTPWPSCDGHEGTPIRATAKTPWNEPTSLVLKAGESQTFALRLQLASAGACVRHAIPLPLLDICNLDY